MEYTPKGIPLSLRPAFQEYELEQLDPQQDAFTVIERTLAYGDQEELAWLFERYDHSELAAWVQRWGWRSLPQRRLRLWATYFGLQDLPQRRNTWPH
ncbi:MAG: hypothetical protein JXA37_04035 [Chloroflexia bacterium]|nr:hypothetical protein [Chloroflexia bacterium]